MFLTRFAKTQNLKSLSLLCLFFKIQPIIYTNEFVGDGVPCVIMGWGYTNRNQFGISNDLLEVSVTTLTNTKCRQDGIPTVGETEICAISDSKKGVCGVRMFLMLKIIVFATPISFSQIFLDKTSIELWNIQCIFLEKI